MSPRPDNCTTCFMGNLSFDIDEDAMREFAKSCGEVKAIRWLTDRESGEFKGCGFIDFASTDGVDEFVKLNGQDLMGRSIRIDYSKPREKKW
jgi:nucleolin